MLLKAPRVQIPDLFPFWQKRYVILGISTVTSVPTLTGGFQMETAETFSNYLLDAERSAGMAQYNNGSLYTTFARDL